MTTTSSATITLTNNAEVRTNFPSMLSASALAGGGVLNRGRELQRQQHAADAIFLIGQATATPAPNGSLGNMYLGVRADATHPPRRRTT